MPNIKYKSSLYTRISKAKKKHKYTHKNKLNDSNDSNDSNNSNGSNGSNNNNSNNDSNSSNNNNSNNDSNDYKNKIKNKAYKEHKEHKAHTSLRNDSISVKFSTDTFYSKPQPTVHMNRKPLKVDKIAEFLDDYGNMLLKNKVLSGSILDNELFNHSDINCICENVLNKHVDKGCKCNNIKTYKIQDGHSNGQGDAQGDAQGNRKNDNNKDEQEDINTIKCIIDDDKQQSTSKSTSKSKLSSKQLLNKHKRKRKRKTNKRKRKSKKNKRKPNILKVLPLKDYYIKLRQETEKYIFLESDKFTIQTLINSYVYKELPNNAVNVISSGICKTEKESNKYYGYNLMGITDLGSGDIFINNVINGKYNLDFNITTTDDKYKIVVNFLLQCVLIIGHLQSSNLEFFHGDYKPSNVYIKKTIKGEPQYFEFNVFNTKIKVKNMGFVVLIANFDKSSISIQGDRYKKKYRFIPQITYKLLLTSYVNNVIKKYGDIDPDTNFEDINIKKFFIGNFLPKKQDPTIAILRSAGIKLYRDFDLYTFFLKLLETDKIRKYILRHHIDETIMAFMSDNFIESLFNKPAKVIGFNETVFIIVDTLNTINEPINRVFTKEYIKTLDLLNYKLFKL